MSETPIRRVAVIGTGVIGASWAAWFLARGLEVTASDPAPGAEGRLRQAVAAHWPTMQRRGLAEGATPDRLTFALSPEEAAAEADFVQENGPERLDLKRELFARLDAAAKPDTILATSSSTLKISDVQTACAHPARVVLGHPFNPPHLIPLVEVVGGQQTAPAAIERAMAFYRAIAKHPILLRKEMNGHIANRLQAALWQEAYYLLQEGVASVADIDAAIAHGPGLRWALLGPFLNLHLSGGAGGMRHLLDHLGPPTEGMWRDLGRVTLTEPLKEQVIRGVDEELAAHPVEDMVRDRDRVLMALLHLKAEAKNLP